MRFAIFPLHLSKVLRLPRKKWCQVIRSAAPVTQNHLSKPEDLIMLQNATPLRKSAPDLLTALMNMSLVLRLPRKMHLCRSSSNVPRLPSFFEMLQNPHVLLTFDKVHNPLRLPRETTSERPKVVRTCGAFHILTSKCASRHKGAHFFDIGNFQRWREDVLLTFWLRNVLRATTVCTFMHFFDISTAKSGPRTRVFCTFWLRNVLRATLACTFSTSQRPKVVRAWCVLCILTWTCASRHNGVQFFISHLARWLRTRCFSEPTFRPSGASNHWKKHSVSRLSYLFAHLDLLSSETFSFLIFFLLLFSDSSHLCFSSVHIVGSLTSKLPSITIMCLGSAIHSCYSSLAPHGRVPVTSRLPGLVASGNMPWDTWLRQRASVCPGIYLYVYTANIYIYI